MNRRRFALFALLLIVAAVTQANPVDLKTAREVALKFMNANTKTPLRGVQDLQLVKTYNIERGEAAFHVFNTPNGFVIVSADDCATPILGYSDEGRPFDTENNPIQLQEYLQGFVDQIQYGIENRLKADEKIVLQWQQVKTTGRMTNNRSYDAVEPLVSALWDQGCYYNAMCPEDPNGYCGGHVPTGCGATAMGMIMHYWGFPTHGKGSLSYKPYSYPEQFVDFGAATYDWTNMPNQLDENSTQEEVDAVSMLLWHCGVALYTNYHALSSSVEGGMVPDAFVEYFNYSEEIISLTKHIAYDVDYNLWFNLIKNNLLIGCPVYYMGNNPNDGHGWVCDGFDSEDLLHFNWGWSGANNGYYSLYSGIGYSMHSAVFNIIPTCDASVTYQISMSSQPNNGGTTSGSGTFTAGQVCNLSANANNGYVFENWTENGVVVSSNPDYSFVITKDRHLEAHFAPSSTISINATPNIYGSGTVSGAGEYEYGQECLLIAEANEGFEFAYWTEYDEVVSMEAAFSFNVVRDRDLKAVFISHELHCNIVFDLSLNGCCSWGGNYLYVDYGDGTSEQFTLENSLGECFVREVINGNTITLSWISGELPSALCFFSVSYMDGQKIYTSPMGYDHEDLDFQFVANCQVQPKNITATVNSEAMGSVKGAGIYVEGGYCVLVAIPNPGCSFAYWAEDGEMVSDRALYAFSVFDDRSLEAVFTMPLSVTASSNLENTGIINGTGAYIYNQECTLTAIPNDGFEFMYWTEGDTIVSVDINYTFKVKTSRNLIAHFVEEGTTCNIVFELFNIWGEPISGWEGNCLVVGRDSFLEYLSLKDNERHAILPRKIIDGNTVSLSWIAGNYNYMIGSKFVIHYENGYPIVECTNPGFEYSDGFVVDCDEAYLPHVVDAVSMGHGSVSGSGTYEAGETCLLTAVPEEGYQFLKWTENGVVVSRDAEYAFPVYADRNLVAHFAEIGTICNLGIHLNWNSFWNGNFLVVDFGDETLERFTVEKDCTDYSIAIVDGSFVSLSWISGFNSIACSFEITYENGSLLYHGDQLDGNFQYAFVFNCDGSLSYNINAMVFPQGGGIVEGLGNYDPGETCNLTAIPSEGYTFINWTEGGQAVSTDVNYSFNVTNNRNLVANFWLENGGIITFIDENVKSICIEHWDFDGDGELSYGEAAAVTSLDNAFTLKDGISSFDELQCFIQLITINDEEFRWCSSLSSIALPNSIISIGNYAFENCSSLVSIKIPSSVTSIGDGAFNNCGSLIHVTVQGKTPPSLGWRVFEGVDHGIPVYVPCGSLSAYQNAVGWNEFTHFIEMCEVTQTTTLNPGWNWFSSYIAYDESVVESLRSQLDALGGTALIKSQSAFASNGTGQWTGSLMGFNNSQLYMIQIDEGVTLTLNGVAAVPSEHPITLKPGWTWMGFVVGETLTLEQVFANVTPNEGDIIKGQGGFSSYSSENGWTGSLNALEPGKGYIYLNNGTADITLIYP